MKTAIAAVAVLTVACGGAPGLGDPTDSGARPPTGPADAGASDAGATTDAGAALDAGGTPDAGNGPVDAGAAPDAGQATQDAGSAIDAGQGDAGPLCGSAGQACCAGVCQAGLQCNLYSDIYPLGHCLEMGDAGEPCAYVTGGNPNGTTAFTCASGYDGNGLQLECDDGNNLSDTYACSDCGYEGGPCCASDSCLGSGRACLYGMQPDQGGPDVCVTPPTGTTVSCAPGSTTPGNSGQECVAYMVSSNVLKELCCPGVIPVVNGRGFCTCN